MKDPLVAEPDTSSSKYTSAITTAMAALWNSADKASDVSKDNADVADTGLADVGLPSPSPQPDVPAGRPLLSRNQPAPPPPHPPPPPPAPQQVGNPTDSLSLMQLRRIVTEFPRVEPIAYAFEYADSAAYEEEIDEWFPYSDAELLRLRRSRQTFERRWKKASKGQGWIEADIMAKKAFVSKEISGLSSSSIQRRCKSLQSLAHIILGVWDETAEQSVYTSDSQTKRTVASQGQVKAIMDGVILFTDCDGISRVYDVLRRAYENYGGGELSDSQASEEVALLQDERENVTTIMYIVVETAQSQPRNTEMVREELLNLRPGIVDYFVTLVAKLRWDDSSEAPQTRIFLLFWKTLLLVFGDTAAYDAVKAATSEKKSSQQTSEDLITASPLDYHLFRQEITSKYPAYVPPAPLIPLDLENNSILPPLPNHPTRNNGSNGILPTSNINSSGASILHQPVHIATPAPSPPPSPAVGGKAGKKQNYQTNQNFPFMYPPLDSTSNSAGGKGLAGLQEALVGRKWEGSEIPASILEAGELFAQRTKMTRATRQLWDERERFLRFERGWDEKMTENDDILEFDLEERLLDKPEQEVKLDKKAFLTVPPKVDYGPHSVKPEIGDRLDRVESFYRGSIPHLQSLVIVLLKAVLANVTALITHPLYPPAVPPMSAQYQADMNARNGIQSQRRPTESNAPPQPPPFDATDLAIVELDALRSREITSKAVSGILMMLLKWFKVSHILKFEYLTQLLLDSNYLPLVLKLFAHSEIDKVVDSNAERLDLSFFHFCNVNSKKAAAAESMVNTPISDGEDDDDAVPPPIKLRRQPLETDAPEDAVLNAGPEEDGKSIEIEATPEVDELGNPVGELPKEPKKDFSWRNFFSSINHLRIMQKICKSKAHRNLLLVQYKSSNILKKALKIPQHELRLYTLKLFKNQVPYCGRKWRQGNMRVITAVYLHCRPELRDDWLAGSDVDAEVEEALPLEQALRALTHWHNVRRYPEQMGADVKLLEAEQDFFIRELEKMDIEIEDEFDDMESQWDGAGGQFIIN